MSLATPRTLLYSQHSLRCFLRSLLCSSGLLLFHFQLNLGQALHRSVARCYNNARAVADQELAVGRWPHRYHKEPAAVDAVQCEQGEGRRVRVRLNIDENVTVSEHARV